MSVCTQNEINLSWHHSEGFIVFRWSVQNARDKFQCINNFGKVHIKFAIRELSRYTAKEYCKDKSRYNRVLIITRHFIRFRATYPLILCYMRDFFYIISRRLSVDSPFQARDRFASLIFRENVCDVSQYFSVLSKGTCWSKTFGLFDKCWYRAAIQISMAESITLGSRSRSRWALMG